jgi:hypothetical protein
LWLTALLLKLPVQEQLQEAHTRTTLGPGTVSPSTLEALELATMPSLTPLLKLNETRSLEPSPWPSGKKCFLSAAHDKLALGTIGNSISDISATFRENWQPNPTKDINLQLSFILHHQF